MTATTETGDLPVLTPAVPAPSAPPAPPADGVPRPASATPTAGELASEVATSTEDTERAATDNANADGPATGSVDAATRSLLDRLRALPSTGLTGPGVIVLAVLLLTPGVLLDLARDGSFGLASSLLFVLAALAAPLVARTRALATAAVLPPLLFVGAVATLAYLSGKNEGSRELVLDVGTTLAVSAPLLFGGTALALVVVLGRVVRRLVRR